MAQSMPRNAQFAARTTIGSNPLCQSYSNRQAWLIGAYEPIYDGVQVLRRYLAGFRHDFTADWTQCADGLPIPYSRLYEGEG